MNFNKKNCLMIGVTVFVLYICIQCWPFAVNFLKVALGAASPLLIGCVIAYMVNILMSFYEKHYFVKTKSKRVIKSRRPVCMVASFVTLAAVVILVIGLVVPQLVSCVTLIFGALPNAITNIIGVLDKYNILPDNIADSLSAIDWQSKIGQIMSMLTTGLGNIMDVVVGTVSVVFSGIVTALMGFIFSIYLLLGRDVLARQFNRLMLRYMRKSWYDKTMYTLGILNDCFRRYITGQCLEAVILGVLCTLGMMILRLPYATMIGALIAFTALIPVAGAYIGGGVGALMVFSVSPVKALIFLIFLVILQQLEGNLIYPRVVGASLGLPAIWVLAAVTVGGGIMGVIGMFLGVPVAAAIYRLLKNDVNKKDINKKDINQKDEKELPEQSAEG